MASYVVPSGETSSGLTVSAGSVTVLDGGVAIDTIINSKGRLIVSSGGEADDTVLNKYGSATVSYGGMASNMIVSICATLNVASGGSALGIKENGGVVTWTDGAKISFLPNAFSSHTYTGNISATIHSGTTAAFTTLNSAADLYVYTGGLVTDTVLKTKSILHVYSGGMAYDTIINSSTRMDINSSGQASGAVVSAGGSLFIASDGSALAIKEEGGVVTWSAGAVVSFVPNVISKYTYTGNVSATIHSGTTATETTLNSAADLYVYTGGLVTDTNLKTKSILHVYSGGMALDTTVNSSTRIDVNSSGMISGAVVSGGGSIYIASAGSAFDIKEEGGIVTWASAGAVVTFVPNVITSHSYTGNISATIHSGTTAAYTTLNSAADILVYTGGLVTDTDLKTKSILHVYSGGRACDTMVNSTGKLFINSSAAASNFIVSSAGSVIIASDGKLTGQIEIISGAVVSASAGAIIDFDISQIKTGAEKRLSNLSLVKGAPVYTLTVDGKQESGQYSLAGGAAGFSKTLTVMNTSGDALGTLTVGQKTTIGDKDYTLNLGSDSVLSVTVGAAAPAGAAKSDIDGNGKSDVMFVWTGEHGEGNYQHGYWMNGTSEWQSQNVGHPASWDNLGNYDMTGDGKADSVLFGNVDEYEVPSAYIGFYQDGIDTDENWVTIGFLTNAAGIAWKNAVGNLTGGSANSIVWYAPELSTLGAWKDGAEDWATLSNDFGGDAWTLVGCGDFDGDGKDSVLMTYNGGQLFYSVGIDGISTSMGSANWSGWEIRAIGDFAGDGKDDLVLFHNDSGSMVMFADGSADDFTSIGQLDAKDWFVVGAGDYNGDGKDDLLVRQYSSGMLGYYSGGNMGAWVEMGRGVDMQWTVIA